MEKKILSVVLIIALTLSFAGCTTYDNFINAFGDSNKIEVETTIKIGVYEPMTGKYKSYGKAEAEGIEIANKMFPEVLGYRVELVYADNCSDMNEAETALKELMNLKPNMVLGSYGDLLTLIGADYMTAASIPAITISATNPLITTNSGYYFTASFPESQTGTALAEYAVLYAMRDKFATVRVTKDDLAQETVKRFNNRLKRLTGTEDNQTKLVLNQAQTDYSDAITSLMQAGSNCVFLCTSSAIAESFITQCSNQGYYPLFIGTTDWDNEEFTKYLEKTPMINVAYASQEAAETTDMYDRFLEAYYENHTEDETPSSLTYRAFDAYLLAIRAIEDAYSMATDSEYIKTLTESAETDAKIKAIQQETNLSVTTGIPTGYFIRNAMLNIKDFSGASGVLSYDGTNEASKKITVHHYYNGATMPPCIIE